MKRHRFGAALAALAVTAVPMALVVPAAAAAAGGTAPFTDPDQRGTLTFCGRNNQPVTSGSLYDRPFAWKAISSAEAPSGYRSTSALTTLYAYQPIQYVDPGDWSGQQLTAGSWFSNPDHPVMQATNLDQSLYGFSNAFPAHWDGLVQIRMFYGSPNVPPETTYYPAAVVRITGSTWTLVSGGGTPCTDGTGKSDEAQYLGRQGRKLLKQVHYDVPTGSPTPTPVGGTTGTGTGTGSGGPGVGGTTGTGATGSGSGSANSGTGSGDGSGPAGATDSADSGGITTPEGAGIGVGALLLLALAAFGVLQWRRSHSEHL